MDTSDSDKPGTAQIVNVQKYIFDDSDSNIEIELNFAFDNYSALF